MIYHFGREYNRKPRFAAGGGWETGYADERVPARKTNKQTDGGKRSSGAGYAADLRQGAAAEHVSCEPTESARELFNKDCEPAEEEQ